MVDLDTDTLERTRDLAKIGALGPQSGHKAMVGRNLVDAGRHGAG